MNMDVSILLDINNQIINLHFWFLLSHLLQVKTQKDILSFNLHSEKKKEKMEINPYVHQ